MLYMHDTISVSYILHVPHGVVFFSALSSDNSCAVRGMEKKSSLKTQKVRRGKEREGGEKKAWYLGRVKENDRRESFIFQFSSHMISSPQKHVGDNLSCQLQLKKRKDKRLPLQRVRRHWKTSNETTRFLRARSGGVHSITHGFGFLPVSITKCQL